MKKFPFELAKLKEKIQQIIENYLPPKIKRKWVEFLIRETKNLHFEAIERAILEPCQEFLKRGGKRWRAILFLLLVKGLGGKINKFKDFAILPELIHQGTLIIDDIEDNSELRRGKPCLHKIYGVDIALNLGNFLYFFPILILREKKKEIKKEIINEIYELYFQEMINLSLGQAMDIFWAKKKIRNIKEKEYLKMCALKTGCLSRFSAKLAGILCQKGKKVIEKLGKFGESLGIAFQIQDDILDLTLKGKEREKFGKVFAQDITEGKKTLLVIHTLKKANSKDKKELLRILEKRTEDKREKERAVEIMEKYNAIEYAKNLSKRIVKKSWEEIERFLPETKEKRKLKSFIFFLIERKL